MTSTTATRLKGTAVMSELVINLKAIMSSELKQPEALLSRRLALKLVIQPPGAPAC